MNRWGTAARYRLAIGACAASAAGFLVAAAVSARSAYWVSTGVDLALAGLCLLGLRWAVKRYRSG